MNDFPQLNESWFIRTRRQFHLIAEIIGKCRETLVAPIAKNDNLWLSVSDGGFSMPAIEKLNDLEIGCNPVKQSIEITNNTNRTETITLNGKSRTEICEELPEIIEGFGISEKIDLSLFHSAKAFDISESSAHDFHAQLVNYNELLREFHAGVTGGAKTQVCLWPHHFDNSFKWFSGKKIDDGDEQMGIGVSNGDDVYALPYIYMTFFPALRKTNTLEIAEGAILYDQEWTGLVLPYDEINERKTIEKQSQLIKDFFETSFRSVQRAFTKR